MNGRSPLRIDVIGEWGGVIPELLNPESRGGEARDKNGSPPKDRGNDGLNKSCVPEIFNRGPRGGKGVGYIKMIYAPGPPAMMKVKIGRAHV